MEFFEVLKKRRSIRAFKNREIKEEKLKQILEAARSAPSAGNLQAYQIFVARNQEIKEKLAEAALGQNFISQAPVVLVFVANPGISAKRYGQRGENLYCLQDATIAATFTWLAAVDLGLSGVWVGSFDEEKVKEILKLPTRWKPIAILPLGYLVEKPLPTSRRPLKDIVRYPE